MDSSKNIAAFEKVCGEGMIGRCGTCLLRELYLRHGASAGFLNRCFVHMMTALFLCFWIHPSIFLWNDPWQMTVGMSMRKLPVQGVASTLEPNRLSDLGCELRCNFNLLLKRGMTLFRQRGDPGFRSCPPEPGLRFGESLCPLSAVGGNKLKEQTTSARLHCVLLSPALKPSLFLRTMH